MNLTSHPGYIPVPSWGTFVQRSMGNAVYFDLP